MTSCFSQISFSNVSECRYGPWGFSRDTYIQFNGKKRAYHDSKQMKYREWKKYTILDYSGFSEVFIIYFLIM
jgi:hypothetical protein